MRILTLDLGTKTGWATSINKAQLKSGSENFANSRFEGGGMRYLKFKKFLTELKNKGEGFDAVYFEEVRQQAKGVDAAHTYGGFMATLTAWCEHHEIPYQGVSVGTIKKSATGKGNAGKDAIKNAMRKKGYSFSDDNEADAIALMLYVWEQDLVWL